MKLIHIRTIAVSLALSATLSAKQPNVLFIAVDDLRPELGCYGVEAIQSPNIDRLAQSGVLFERAYCQLAVCNPSRVSLLTGLRPDSAKVWTLDVQFRDTVPDVVTLPQHFKANGYHAVSYGKIFHNPWPDNQSWSEPHEWPKDARLWSKDAKKALVEFKKKMKADGKSDAAIKRMRAVATEIVDMPDSEHKDGAIADQALDAMRRLSKGDKPFFLAAGFVRPHLPFVVPRKYWEMYDREKLPLAENGALPKGAPDFAMNTMYELRDYMDYADSLDPRKGSLSEAQQRELKHGYYAAVSLIDAQIGRLLDELAALKLESETIVVLWGDHGWKLGEHNSWCKQSNYEIDARAPLIIRAPGAALNGEKSRSLVEFVDIYPTLCELAQIPQPEHLEGVSLVPALVNPRAKIKDAAISQFQRRLGKRLLMGYSMRTDQFRYVEWLDRRTRKVVAQELYDHNVDSQENTNTADDSDQQGTLVVLHEQLWKTIPMPKSFVAAKKKKAVKSKPNILFLMADDWSYPHAGALGDQVVKTPTFDRLVREGVLFDNAFVTSPSCTPSRHAILSGQYHWRLKDGMNLGGSIPKETPVYPDLLVDAGYATGFSRKGAAPSPQTHRGNDPFGPRFRNFETFYKEREKGKPFCFWYGAGEPHRPYEWESSAKARMDLQSIKLPAGLPDNATTRTDMGDYYMKVQRFDRDAAGMIALLEKNGELDNTIVVISGDNGMPFPRCKATLYDGGTRVPLVVRWGAKVKGGRKVDDFVSLTDLAPTFLEAAGLDVPDIMTGRSLMSLLEGESVSGRDYVLTGMERHVYAYPSRAIRTADFLYIRNFGSAAWPNGKVQGEEPEYDFVKTPWPVTEGAFSFNIDPSPTKQWMRKAGMFDGLERKNEELYDLKKDPGQLQNAAENPAFRETRDRLSDQLTKELRESGDPRFALSGHATFPVRGWKIHLDDRLWQEEPEKTSKMLDILSVQLERVVNVVPAKALKELRKVPIWINPTYKGLRASAEYHPGADWLRSNGRNPAMAKAIEITNVAIFPFENRRMPYLLLHELSHAYHDRVLGFDDAEIIEAFNRAKESGTYDKVERFTGEKTVMDKAYAMSNEKEYFAETTEALFGKNDFYPFTKDELKKHDPKMLEVLLEKWGVE